MVSRWETHLSGRIGVFHLGEIRVYTWLIPADTVWCVVLLIRPVGTDCTVNDNSGPSTVIQHALKTWLHEWHKMRISELFYQEIKNIFQLHNIELKTGSFFTFNLVNNVVFCKFCHNCRLSPSTGSQHQCVNQHVICLQLADIHIKTSWHYQHPRGPICQTAGT